MQYSEFFRRMKIKIFTIFHKKKLKKKFNLYFIRKDNFSIIINTRVYKNICLYVKCILSKAAMLHFKYK